MAKAPGRPWRCSSTKNSAHVFQHRAWAEFFLALRDQGDRGVFVVGFMSLAFGSLIVAFHNVWSGLPMVLTILGWAQVLKGLLYFTLPSYGLRKLGIVDIERARMFVWPGLVSAIRDRATYC